jgi:hypothetical protein
VYISVGAAFAPEIAANPRVHSARRTNRVTANGKNTDSAYRNITVGIGNFIDWGIGIENHIDGIP